MATKTSKPRKDTGAEQLRTDAPPVVEPPAAAVTPPAPDPDPAPADVEPVDECNTAGCRRPPTTRGLCGAHWATRRGDMTRETSSG